MRKHSVEKQLRRFLLAVSVCVFAGTVVELLFAEHAESVVQIVPFVLCGLGAAMALAAFYAPRRKVLLLLRGVMAVVVLGSVFGWYEHFEHNLAFELEIRPNATPGDVFWEALHGATHPSRPVF